MEIRSTFLYVITAILPIFIGLFFQKTFLAGMKILVSLFFYSHYVDGRQDQSISCLRNLSNLANGTGSFLQAISKKQGWQVGILPR